MRSFRPTAVLLLCLAALLVSCLAASAAIDKVVYRDPNYLTSWTNADVSDAVTQYLVSKGYTQVDAAGLRDFCLKHVQDNGTSVVVNANGVLPDTVMEPGDNNAPNPGCLLNQYLQHGGKVIYLFDWPAYYVGLADGTNYAWNDTGAAAALGFWPCRWNGNTDLALSTVFNDEGKKWGLTKPWISNRPSTTSDIDIPLGNLDGRPDVIMPWVKTYTWGRNGAGFIYMYDHDANAATAAPLDEEDYAQIDRVASYFPDGETVLYTLSGTVKDDAGKPVAGIAVNVTGDQGTKTVYTAPDGTYTMAVPPGTYSLLPVGESVEATAGPVSVTVTNAAATANLSVSNLPNFSISTGAGVQWLLQAGGSADDNSNADPKLDDSSWDLTDSGTDCAAVVGTNTYFWYRAHFTVPAAIKAYKDRYLVIYDYCIDDNDWTYLNGHFLGNINGWNTPRKYIIDPSWINWDGDNVIAIKAWQGTGGAGFNNMSAAGPQIHVGSSALAVLKGQLTTAGSSVAPAGVTVTAALAGTNKTVTATPDANGAYMFTNLTPGSYSLTVSGRTVVSTSPATAAVDAPGGKIATAQDIAITFSSFAIDKPDATISDDFNASTLNAKWTAEDIGTTDPGDQSISNGVLVVHADGADIWTGGDNFRYVYQKNITGDFQATLHVLNVPDTDGWSKVGIMARASTDPMSLHAFACATRDNGESLQGRTSANPENNFSANAGTFTQGTGYYVKLLRRGNHFEAYKSPDGVTNFFVGEFDSPNMPQSVLLGIAVTSHSAGNMGEAKVDDFVFSSQLPGPITPPPTVVKGDANGDGKVLVNDAVLALQFAIGLKTPTADQLAACDLNGDGKITINEVTLILQAAVGLRTL